jgi:uncharacterized protein YodC (DUF2158 family)
MGPKDLKCGDVVKLKSGGPPMTFEQMTPRKDGTDACGCVWFYDGELNRKSFHREALEVVPPAP